MTPDRAIMHIAGTLIGYIALLMVPIGLVVVAVGADQLHWDEPPWQGPYLIAYGFYSVIAGSAGFNAGLNMVRSRHLTFCCVGASMVVAAGVVPLFLDEDSIAFWGVYILVLTVPATVMLYAARAAFGDGLELPEPRPAVIPPFSWPQPPATAAPPPFSSPTAQATSANDVVHQFVPPPMPPPGMPPFYPYQNPPRLIYLKDVGRARAVKAGILATVAASILAYFGLEGIFWPLGQPGFGFGVLALIGVMVGPAGGYLALLRIRKGLAIGMEMYLAFPLLLLTRLGFVWERWFGILYLPFLILGLAVLWATWRAYAPVRMPFPMPPPPMPFPPTPPKAR